MRIAERTDCKRTLKKELAVLIPMHSIAAILLTLGLSMAGCGGPPHITTCDSDSDCTGNLKCIKSYQVTQCTSGQGCSCDSYAIAKICTHSCTKDSDCSDALYGDKPSTCEAATTCSQTRNLCN